MYIHVARLAARIKRVRYQDESNDVFESVKPLSNKEGI